MAALAGQQVLNVFKEGDADRIALYAIRNVTTGDTVDMSADYQAVKRAVVVGATTSSAGLGTISAGTVITLPSGLAADAAWLLVWGSA